jgi:hypothetical protein
MAAAIAKTGKASTKIDQLEVIQKLLRSAALSFATLISGHGSEHFGAWFRAENKSQTWTVPPAHSAEAHNAVRQSGEGPEEPCRFYAFTSLAIRSVDGR